MTRFQIRILLLLGMMLFPLRSVFGQELSATQDQLKAVFLYNFTQFIEWPPESFRSPDEPFIIGLYGPDAFGKHLLEAVRNERVDGHPIRVMTVNATSDLKLCRMLFIHRTMTQEFSQLAPSLRSTGILTVSDAADFCRSGGVIGFVNEKNKIRLQINMDAAANAQLKISSKLLRLAEIVSPKS
jgi:hypothetical protein